jgi:predicted secreted Zn-dependent protease
MMGLYRVNWVSLVALPFLLLMATPGDSETIFRKSTTYFTIGGSTVADLDRELVRLGPLSSTTGRRHPGATRIKFNGTATFVSKDGRCFVRGAHISLSTRIMLPRWSNRKRANRDMGNLWDTISADIKRHEERHAEIARTHALALEKTILSLPSAGDCAVLKAKVSKVSQLAMVAHDADQQRFDRIEAINFKSRRNRLLKNRSNAFPSK